jgi:hypothetical protein
VKEALEAADRYATQYGRYWKSKLADHWYNETFSPPRNHADAPLLRQLRNHPSFGHAWLRKYKPSAPTIPVAFEPNMKGRVGRFEYWHVGYLHYEVRCAGEVLRACGSLMQASREAQRLYDLEKAGVAL